MNQSGTLARPYPQGSVPVLYSFRRCPYAMRARLALLSSGVRVELREILLRQKPAEFLSSSRPGTVPCLVKEDGTLTQSLDIMHWALSQNDPERWLQMPADAKDWINRTDGPFKTALDRTKYASRYPDEDPADHRAIAEDYLAALDRQIDSWIFERPTLADFSILPFVRQYAFTNKQWFDGQPWPRLQGWLQRFLVSSCFEQSMIKLPPWKNGDPPVYFPA